jgi:hypothetical protein
MKNEQYMTDADWQELADIEATVVDARKRRKRLMGRLRQRAHQARKVK